MSTDERVHTAPSRTSPGKRWVRYTPARRSGHRQFATCTVGVTIVTIVVVVVVVAAFPLGYRADQRQARMRLRKRRRLPHRGHASMQHVRRHSKGLCQLSHQRRQQAPSVREERGLVPRALGEHALQRRQLVTLRHRRSASCVLNGVLRCRHPGTQPVRLARALDRPLQVEHAPVDEPEGALTTRHRFVLLVACTHFTVSKIDC